MGLKALTKGKSTKVKNICSTEVDDGSLSLSSLSGPGSHDEKLPVVTMEADEDFNVVKID